MISRHLAASAAAALLAAAPAAVQAASLRLSTGVDYSTGGYGEKQDTDVVYVPLTAKLYTGAWTFRASASWLSVSGPADVTVIDDEGGGVDPGSTGSPGRHRTDRQGFGDSYLGAKYSFQHLGGGPLYLDIQGRVRLPTGDHDKGLGVGAVDWLTDAELGAEWKAGGVYADLGRRFLGDTSRQVRQDGWAYSVGGWAKFDERTELGIWYFTRDPTIAGFDRPREVGAYVARRLTGNWRAEIALYEGLSQASADFGTAFTITWRPGWGHRRR